MYNNYTSPYYSRSYGKSSQAERDRPSTLNLGGLSGSSGSSLIGGGGGTLGGSGNLGGSGIGSSGGGGGGSGSGLTGSGSNMPNKPSRYTPSSASSAAAAAASSSKLSSYTSGAGGGGIPPLTSSSYPSTYGPRGTQEVITVPPKSTLTLGQSSQYHPSSQPLRDTSSSLFPLSSSSSSSSQQAPSSSLRYYSANHPLHTPASLRLSQQQHQPQVQHEVHLRQPQQSYQSVIVDRPLNTVTTSKSTHNLIMDSIPDVFCLSCPPAEFKFSDAYRAKTLPRTGKENERLIGFATLPEQVHRKSVKKGFDFTLMAVGESGLGKSTLINSLFLADFYQNRKIPSVSEKMKRTTTIQKNTIEIEERGVKLRLTVVDTPGFGDAINCEDSWKTCVDYIDEQFQQYFQAESGLNRRHIQDTRIHCCLYFIPPYGHGLRPLDIEVLKHLQSRVNVIPIIAKADTLTPAEVRKLKDQILEDLRVNQIQIYQFPECDEEEDEEFKQQDKELKAAIPFAVASSETFVEVAGRKVRGRQYPWGIVEVENPMHSDFGKLRTMLIQSHMHDLKETTQDLHYENFRAKAIAQISNGGPRERSKLKRDSSAESPQDILQQKEAEIKRMQQMISKMEAKLKAAGQQPKSMRDSIIDL